MLQIEASWFRCLDDPNPGGGVLSTHGIIREPIRYQYVQIGGRANAVSGGLVEFTEIRHTDHLIRPTDHFPLQRADHEGMDL